MALTFLAGAAAGADSPPARRRCSGAAAWLMMAFAFQPTLRLYRSRPLWGLALPLIALAYMVFTIDSALQYARGHGGLWKGRAQAARARRTMTLAADLRSGKGHRDENFPVASLLIARAPPHADPGLLRLRARGRRRRRSSVACRRPRSSRCSTAWRRRCSAKATPSRKASRCATCWPSARADARSTRTTCSPPSASTSPSCATPTGTS